MYWSEAVKTGFERAVNEENAERNEAAAARMAARTASAAPAAREPPLTLNEPPAADAAASDAGEVRAAGDPDNRNDRPQPPPMLNSPERFTDLPRQDNRQPGGKL